MDWLQNIGAYGLSTFLWLVGLAAGFGLLAWQSPCNPGMFWWRDRRALSTDIWYWFVVPPAMQMCRDVMLTAGIILFFKGHDPHLLPVQELSLWQQCLATLIIQDVLLYWIHRGFHKGWAWKFHAVHHSPKVLDWTAMARFHPVNNLLAFVVADAGVLLLGFPLEALGVLAVFNLINSAMQHANLDWTFGPLQWVFASPVFHRWHHATDQEALDKNFADTFSFLDVIFGTFYMPAGKLPKHFGTGEADVPEGFLGQLFYPFQKRTSAAPLSKAPPGQEHDRKAA